MRRPLETSDDVLERLELEKTKAAERAQEAEIDEAIRVFRAQNQVPPQHPQPTSSGNEPSSLLSLGLCFDDQQLDDLHPFFRTRYLQQQQQQQEKQGNKKGPEETDLAFVPSARDDALMIYTSGTTARPKGVVHTHRSISQPAAVLLDAWRWTPDDVTVNVLPLPHVHGLVNICCARWQRRRVVFSTV